MKKIFYIIVCFFAFSNYVFAEDILVERIMIETPSLYVDTSKSMYMTANIYPTNATNKEVTWSSSDTSIATINASTGGLSTKSKKGTVTITARATDGSGVVGQIVLRVGYAYVEVGKEISVGNSSWVSYDTVEWTIDDPTILEKTNKIGYTSIGSSYKHYLYVKGIRNGNTTVKMKTISGDILASNVVYVYTPLESLTSEQDSYEIEKGTSKQLNILLNPSTVSNEFKTIHYTSNDATIASVSNTGLITGVKPGHTNIRIYSQYYSKSLTIPVDVVIYTNEMTINTNEIKLNNDTNSFQIEYEVLPSNASNKEVIFTSDDTSIATVNKNGKVVAISNGETNIKMKTKDGKVTKTIHVIVSDYIPCTEINFNTEEVRINSNETFKVNYTLIPNSCSNIQLNWQIEDESIATVNSKGEVTGLKTGGTTLIITADNGLRYTIKVNVNNYVAVKSFNIEDEKIVITTDGKVPTYRVNYVLGPTNASFKSINWQIEDETIATVSEDGIVTAISSGNTRLIGTTVDGNYIDSVNIEVIVGYYEVDIYYVDQNEVYHYDGGCGWANHIIEHQIIYYPEKYEFKDDYYYNGYKVDNLYGSFDCYYSNKFENIINKNIDFKYNGGGYTFYTGDLSEIHNPIVNITSDNNIVKLTWNSQETANYYEIYRSTSSNGNYSYIKLTFNNEYVDSNLAYGKTYYYKIVAVSDYYHYNNINKTTVVSKKIVPNKVILSIKNAGTNNVKLGWDKVNVTGYEVYSSTDQKKWTKVTTITKNGTLEYNVKKLKDNKTYYFKVRAYKTVSGKKVYGSYSDVVSTKTAPKKPTLKLALKDYNAMNVEMGSVKGATLFRLEKSLDGSNYTLVEELPGAGVLASENQILGQTYYFRVKACNSENRCSGWVKVNLKQTTKTPGFSLKTSSKKVTISINKVNGATGYQIYSATKKNGKYSKIKEFSSEVELLEYVNKTKKGKTYYYKVRSFALDAKGNRIYSPYSKVKSIKSK